MSAPPWFERHAARRSIAHARRSLAAALCCAVTLGAPGTAGASPLVLRTAAQDNNTLKYELRATHKGICVDVIKALERTDPKLHFNGWTQSMSLPRIETALAEGQLDAFCALIPTKARAAKFDFIDVPVYTVRHKVAVRANDKVTVSSLEDIRKLAPDNIIIVSKGTAHEELLKATPGLTVDATSRDTDVNLRKLLHQRGRFFYHSDIALRRYIADEELKGMIRLLPTVFNEEALYFAVSATLPPAAKAQLRQALRTLAERGELQKIYDRYEDK